MRYKKIKSENTTNLQNEICELLIQVYKLFWITPDSRHLQIILAVLGKVISKKN